jgi:hypothetical protein
MRVIVVMNVRRYAVEKRCMLRVDGDFAFMAEERGCWRAKEWL